MHLDVINFTLYYKSTRIIDNRGTLMLDKNEFTKTVGTVFFAKSAKLNTQESSVLLDSLNRVPEMNNELNVFVYNLGFTQLFSKTEYFLYLLINFSQVVGEHHFSEVEIDSMLEKHFDIIKPFLNAPTCSALFTFNCGLHYGNTLAHRKKITNRINKQHKEENDDDKNAESSIHTLFQSSSEIVDTTLPQVSGSEMTL